MTAAIPPHIIKEIAELQKDPFEHNGQLFFQGGEMKYNSQKGQTMSFCSDCEANWHTHPSNYEELYPDHPSSIDMQYIFKATCKDSMIGTHLVFTPKYIYTIRYKCKNAIVEVFDFLTISKRINSTFESLAAKHDRNTQDFRDAWTSGLRQMGFEIEIYAYTDTITIVKKTVHNPSLPIILLAVPFTFFFAKTFT